ncbi:hypothetical protein ACFE04_021343 [Oxalis oulophora]
MNYNQLETGLRPPLNSFQRDLLDSYSLAVGELMVIDGRLIITLQARCRKINVATNNNACIVEPPLTTQIVADIDDLDDDQPLKECVFKHKSTPTMGLGKHTRASSKDVAHICQSSTGTHTPHPKHTQVFGGYHGGAPDRVPEVIPEEVFHTKPIVDTSTNKTRPTFTMIPDDMAAPKEQPVNPSHEDKGKTQVISPPTNHA